MSGLSEFFQKHSSGVKENNRIYYATGDTQKQVLENIKKARKVSKQVYIIVDCIQDPRFRLDAFAAGASMLANENDPTIIEVIEFITTKQQQKNGKYSCPVCNMSGLTEDSLCRHVPLYHQAEPNVQNATCPICSAKKFSYNSFEFHLHNMHGPLEGREEPTPMFAAFAWVIVRHPETKRYLISNEPACIAGNKPNYWLPAGRVDAGETFTEAGVRETLEEGGIKVKITGVLKFMLQAKVVPRIVLMAEPVDLDACIPKSIVDWESCGSFWVAVNDLQKLDRRADFRSADPCYFFPGVEDGELEVYDIENDSFQALESMVSSLTLKTLPSEKDYISHVERVWLKLKSYYPKDAFNY